MCDREVVTRGLDNTGAAQEFLDAMWIHYNKTPSVIEQKKVGCLGLSFVNLFYFIQDICPDFSVHY
jgi:hypothetical protein